MVTIAGDNGIDNTASKNVSLQREGHGGDNAGGGEIVDTNVPIFLDDTFDKPPPKHFWNVPSGRNDRINFWIAMIHQQSVALLSFSMFATGYYDIMEYSR